MTLRHTQRYLVLHQETVFFSPYYSRDFFSPGTKVCDLKLGRFTVDGQVWHDIEEDHL